MIKIDYILNALEIGATRANRRAPEEVRAHNELLDRIKQRARARADHDTLQVVDRCVIYKEPDIWLTEMRAALDRIVAQRDRRMEKLTLFMLERGRGNSRIPYPDPEEDDEMDDESVDEDGETDAAQIDFSRGQVVQGHAHRREEDVLAEFYRERNARMREERGIILEAMRNPGDSRIPYPDEDARNPGEPIVPYPDEDERSPGDPIILPDDDDDEQPLPAEAGAE